MSIMTSTGADFASKGHPPEDAARLDLKASPHAAARQAAAAKARRESGRLRGIDPTTCDRDYAADEVEFMNAVQAYKASSGRMFPTWSEVLEVLRGLGYDKD
jgi:hypothetical protein